MVASASAFGLDTIQDPSKYGLSLTLGGGEVTMLDMAEAFSVFANTGIRKDLISILNVTDKQGTILEKNTDPNFVENITQPLAYPSSILIDGTRVVSAETAFLINHILLDNNARSAAFGTNSALVIPGKNAVSVKTGTTNDLRDNWTIGYTPNYLVASWVGNNDNSAMSSVVSGVSGATPIWNRIMRHILANQDDLWPKQPAGIVGRTICMPEGRLPKEGEQCASPRYEYFIQGTEQGSAEPIRQPVLIDKTTGTMAKPDQTDNVEQQDKTLITDVYGTTYCIDCAIPGQTPEEK